MAMRSSITSSSKKKRRAPILLIGGDKGGVGKSFGGRVVAGFLRLRSYSFVGFDGDMRNGHLSRFYEASETITRTKLRDAMGWTEMYNLWEHVPEDIIILVDLPGNIGDMLESEAHRLRLLSQALGREIINLWVANEEEDSIWLLQTALEVADATRTIFWMNGRFGADKSKFQLWQESNTRRNFLVNGGTEAFLPLLPIYPRTRIGRARSPFHDVSEANLSVTEKIDFDIWWARVEKELEPLAGMLP